MPLALMQIARAAIFFIAFALWLPSWGQALQPVPALTGHVVDHTGTLGDTQKQALEDKLAALEQAKGSQVVVLMVPTTQPEDIASYANRIGNAWKIGRQGVGDGLLLLVAKDDRKVRIEVGRGLEGVIPDAIAKRNPVTTMGRKAQGIGFNMGKIFIADMGRFSPEETGRPQHLAITQTAVSTARTNSGFACFKVKRVTGLAGPQRAQILKPRGICACLPRR